MKESRKNFMMKIKRKEMKNTMAKNKILSRHIE